MITRLPAASGESEPVHSGRVAQSGDGGVRGYRGPEVIDAIATAYMVSKGMTLRPQPYGRFSEKQMRRIADYAHVAQHEPLDQDVIASYCIFRHEVLDQFLFLGKLGVVFERWARPGEPYRDSTAMLDDLWRNHHLFYFPTEGDRGEGGFGSGNAESRLDHPLLEMAWHDEQGRPVLYNDAFRCIHDVFGHGRHGWQFGPRGEENAWMSHMAMFSPGAWMALASETRAQTCWFNFGPHLRRADGSIPKKGEQGFVPMSERPYAEQKAMWLPFEFYSTPEVTTPSSAVPAAYCPRSGEQCRHGKRE